MKICVAFPTYNRAEYLQRAVLSFMDQLNSLPSAVNIDFTIYDNASTDNTPSVCRDLKRQFPQIAVIRHEINMGGDANIHQALLAGKGDFIWVFGDDDYLKSGALRIICETLRGFPTLLKLNGDEERDLDSGKHAFNNSLKSSFLDTRTRSFQDPDQVLVHFGLAMGNFTKTIFSRTFVSESYVRVDEALFQSGYSQLAWMYEGAIAAHGAVKELEAKVVVTRIELAPRGLVSERMIIGLRLLRDRLLNSGYKQAVVDDLFKKEKNAVILGEVKVKRILCLPVGGMFWSEFARLAGAPAKLKLLAMFLIPNSILRRIWLARS